MYLKPALFAWLLAPSLSQAQPVMLTPVPDPEPTLNVKTVVFDCKDHFAGKGKGVCTQILEANFRNAPAGWKNPVVRCDATWSFKKQSSPAATQLRELKGSAPMAPRGSWGVTRVVLSSDFGSVTDETVSVDVASHRCDINWSY